MDYLVRIARYSGRARSLFLVVCLCLTQISEPVASAQQEQQVQPASGTVLVRANAPCKLTIDGENAGSLSAGELKKLSLAKGEHIFEAVRLDEPASPWSRVITVRAGEQSVATVEFRIRSQQEIELSNVIGTWELVVQDKGSTVEYRNRNDERKKKNGTPYDWTSSDKQTLRVYTSGPQVLAEYRWTFNQKRDNNPYLELASVQISFGLPVSDSGWVHWSLLSGSWFGPVWSADLAIKLRDHDHILLLRRFSAVSTIRPIVDGVMQLEPGDRFNDKTWNDEPFVLQRSE
ncbi:MAG TPA: hypothetical protein VMB25_21660 [Bryobacteraceae bacterium]|nr:hypothetical protein [Bryobacteraceae bacterium]